MASAKQISLGQHIASVPMRSKSSLVHKRKTSRDRSQADETYVCQILIVFFPSLSLFLSCSEIEQSLAAAISDRATDEVLEALTRYRRGLGIAESPSVLLDEPQTPDIVRSRSSHVSIVG